MEITEAKQWVYRYFGEDVRRERGGRSRAIYTRWSMCSAAAWTRYPSACMQEYKGARTYHDLWREVQTDHIIEERDDPHQWMPDLYHVYIRDQEVRGESPSKAGFRAWLNKMIGDDDALNEAMEHWTADMVQ